jgi:hypothetical protein
MVVKLPLKVKDRFLPDQQLLDNEISATAMMADE